eukprot:TRINITY_DN26277_c0_g1_i1.p1 TRINITY_DN26277_c0_g1~~TRINITY_DN26277_c0_g1_i1.p1  ORF type:complete len:815 (-),score=130.86 TRINITY_DN26277_c0_g1_i1:201-2615(-)
MTVDTLLEVTPSDTLVFYSRGERPTASLTLRNKSSGYVAWKIKTTAPKELTINPSSGTLAGGESYTAKVFFNGQDPSGILQYRFLLQACSRSEDNKLSKEQWDQIPKNEVHEKKLNAAINSDVLDVTPKDTLVFDLPSGGKPSASWNLDNKSSGFVAWKIQTTAPNDFVINPCTGTIAKGQSCTVKVEFQGDDLSSILRHRFLLLAASRSDDVYIPKDQWNKVAKDKLQEEMLNVAVNVDLAFTEPIFELDEAETEKKCKEKIKATLAAKGIPDSVVDLEDPQKRSANITLTVPLKTEAGTVEVDVLVADDERNEEDALIEALKAKGVQESEVDMTKEPVPSRVALTFSVCKKHDQEVTTKCKQGHGLVAVGRQHNGSWACDAQKEPGGCLSGCTGFNQSAGWYRYRCDKCDYDLCGKCIERREGKAAPMHDAKDSQDDVDEFVQVLTLSGLGQFIDKLRDDGYDSVDMLKAMSDDELKDVGFKGGHIKKLHATFGFSPTSRVTAYTAVASSLNDLTTIWNYLDGEVAEELVRFSWENSVDGVSVADCIPGTVAFSKLEEWWKQSCKHHVLSRIELLNIPFGAKSFDALLQRLGHGRGNGVGGPLNPANYADAHYQAGLESLKSMFVQGRNLPRHANVIFTWHGTKHDIAHTVAGNGLRPLRSTDGGYFGGGTYTAREAWYAAQYSLPIFGGSANSQGEYVLLFCATAIGAAYIVTLDRDYTGKNPKGFSDMFSDRPDDSKCLKPSYDTHFVPVKYYGKMFDGDRLPYDVDFQASPESDAEAHEVVSYSFDQVLPLALVYFRPR